MLRVALMLDSKTVGSRIELANNTNTKKEC